ncbi:MAG TPA: hypothetical protein VLE73_06280 [Candidatus Saccharimonadales bacterium]|nr:hypothetical protein [Candidatus Saccharimonadales bacterium]
MQNLSDLLSLEEIKRLSLPSNFAYGKAICDRGAVELIHKEPAAAEAWVGGLDGTVIEGAGSRRRTQLYVSPKGLAWHCTGNPKNHDIFCKHCVALALALLGDR